jgi:hypothetical protein
MQILHADGAFGMTGVGSAKCDTWPRYCRRVGGSGGDGCWWVGWRSSDAGGDASATWCRTTEGG